jgi:hypothetical protein
MTVNDSGYAPYRTRINVQGDTALSIKLSAIENNTQMPSGIPPEGQDYWRISSLLLALVAIGLLWKMLSDRKRQASLEEVNSNLTNNPLPNRRQVRELEQSIILLNKQIKDKDALINKYSSEIQSGHPVFKETGTRYFLSELMMTAGPRKKRMSETNADKDLGEDVCGFILKGEDILTWLLDGTSDFYCLRNPDTQKEYFSSRLLAQSIARELKTHFGEGRMEAFDQTMSTIINDVKSKWLEAIRLLPDSEKGILKNNIKSGNFPECATTVLIGRFSLNGELIVYRSGDSKMLVYGQSANQKVFLNTSLSAKNAKSNDRVFFRLALTDQGELDILHNKPIFEIVKMEKIRTIIGMSDGIGKETEDDLKKEYPENSDAMRNEIIYQVQGTEDDKSLYIIELKE